MDKQEYKLEKLKARIEQEKQLTKELGELLKNPILEYILGTMFIGWIWKPRDAKLGGIAAFIDGAIRGANAATMETMLVGIITAQQMAPSLPYLVQAGEKMIGGYLK